MERFHVEFFGSERKAWKRSENCRGTFNTYEDALDCVRRRADYTQPYRIIEKIDDISVGEMTRWEGTRAQAERGEGNMADLLDQSGGLEPLNLDREQLIDALTVKADEETAKRETEQAKLDEARKEAIEAIQLFSPQELYEIFRANFTVVTEDLTRFHEDEKYVPKPVAKSVTETDVERAIRVLSLSADKTVPVRQGTDLYRLL